MRRIDDLQTLLVFLDLPAWPVYARVPDRHDVYIFDHRQVRFSDALQVNAGEQEFSAGRPRIIPGCEEWIAATSLYAKHQCEGCTYPPDMCCLSGISPDDDEAWDGAIGEYDQAITDGLRLGSPLDEAQP